MNQKNLWLVAGLLTVAPSVWAATGSVSLIDASGLKYFINTNVTFSTSSSASGANSEASYTHGVSADTLNGGFVNATLSDAFDGYDATCVSLTGASGPCTTGSAAYTIYNNNGAATLINGGREVQFNPQTIGGLTVTRRVFVPSNDVFQRTLNFFTNTTGAPITFTVIASNNLGSDSNTKITATDSGDLVATTADRWVASFQDWSGTTSTDPRLCHVFTSTGAAIGLNGINFVNGDDNPYWSYVITLQPGQTGIIAHFVSGQPTRAAAAAKCAELAGANNGQQFAGMSATEKSQVLNFKAVATAAAATVDNTISGGVLGADFLLVGLGALGLSRRRRKS